MTNAWYPHYPGDYARDTGHLSMVQHGAYRLLLDHYYATGAPLPADFPVLYRLCRAFSREERKAVDFVLSNFFGLQPDGYHNKRADIELAKAHDLHERRSRGGQKTAEKRWRANSSATSSATSSMVGNPQPQPQPQPQREEKSAETANAAQLVAFSSELLVVTQSQDSKLGDTYPWVDRSLEYKKMALWLDGNRPGRKVRNVLTFCQNWFNKIPKPSVKENNHGKAKSNIEITLEGLRQLEQQDRPD